MSWIKDIFAPEQRQWEDFYRNRWSYDKIVRSTHGVNCTGSCSWNIYVKNGIVTWEMQALDYPILDKEIPPYEPRGCQRGISYSWYIYSPLRVKYPHVRGALIDLWRKAKAKFPDDPVAAWDSVVSDPESRQKYQQARGKGGFRRCSWDEVNELMAAANIHTIKKHGPDRIVGFSPIPAMSMVSYASGARFLQLMGGVCLSFYDWYCDLPPASPEIWGEQTDVAESADWFNSRYIAVVGSNVLMTRTPDAHFLVEARHRGTKVVVFSPDFSQTSKVADEWIPIHQGQDGAFWMAVCHVILKEHYVDRQTPYFTEYLKSYSDLPFLVALDQNDDGSYRPGRDCCARRRWRRQRTKRTPSGRCSSSTRSRGVLRICQGHRRPPLAVEEGRMEPEARGRADRRTDRSRALPPRRPEDRRARRVPRLLGRFDRHVPLARRSGDDRRDGRRTGPRHNGDGADARAVRRRARDQADDGDGDWPTNYDDDSLPYTPAWQERFTGVAASTVVKFAREWAHTAQLSEGKCSIIIGAGVNHWYHNNLIYRSAIAALILTGCVGKNGGGWNHYVGQEKLAPQASWAPIAFATDWGGPPRLQNAPSFHYVHSDQWRYDREFREVCPVSDDGHPMSTGHTIDKQIMAVRNGWLPCYPQFNTSSLELVREAEAAGVTTCASSSTGSSQLKSCASRSSMRTLTCSENFPRSASSARQRALPSAKGHEHLPSNTTHQQRDRQGAGARLGRWPRGTTKSSTERWTSSSTLNSGWIRRGAHPDSCRAATFTTKRTT